MRNSSDSMTGFQSPCAEYAEDPLSLDQRYLRNTPATFIIETKGAALHLGIRAGDRLIIDRSLSPKEGQLILLVMNNAFTVLRYKSSLLTGNDPDTGDFIWGVVTTLLRENP